MSFETTKDVLDYVREFHRHLSEFYHNLSNKTERQRVKLLLDYLSGHEKHLEENLARYEEDVSERILNAWFQYPPPKEVLNACKCVVIEDKEDLSVDSVIEMALQLDDCLIDLYKEMVKSSEFEEVKEVFNNLLAMTKQKKMDLVRDSHELKDM